MENSILLKSAHQIPTITICSDASFDPELKIGAWACYIRTDNETVKTGKTIEKAENSTEAERIGIAGALWIVDRMVDLKKHKIILYCDSVAAMRPVKYSKKTGQSKQQAKKQLEFYQKNIEPLLQKALMCDIRFVKGHMDRSKRHLYKTKHYMNDWADNKAKRLLREYRGQSLPEGK